MFVKTLLLLLTLICAYQCNGQHVYDVIILGGGCSGIGAAVHLHERGIKNFLLLEGEDKLGGRVRSAQFAGKTVNMGAGWIHRLEDRHIMWRFAQKYHMQYHKELTPDVLFRDGETGFRIPKWKVSNRQRLLRLKIKAFEEMYEKRIAEGRHDIDVKTGLHYAGWKAQNKLDRAMEYLMLDFENGIRPEFLSASSYGYTGEGGDLLVTDPRGYEYMVIAQTKPFANKIKLNQQIIEIEHKNGLHRVVTSIYKSYFAKHILVTFSSGVLQTNDVKFSPPLPSWKKEALALVPMCHYCKIFMHFPIKFWDSNGYILVVTKKRGHYMHYQNYELYSKRNILIATITGEFCEDSYQLNDTEITQEIMNTLRKVYKTAPDPLEILRNKWSIEKNFRGAYSFQVPGITEDDYRALEHPIMKSLWFTGEYTARTEFGYTHSAYEAGYKMAGNIMKCMNGTCPSELPERRMKNCL